MCALYDETTKLWSSMDRKQSVNCQGQLILNLLCSHGSKVAQVYFQILKLLFIFSEFLSLQINDDTGTQLTYNEIWLNTIRVAQNLLKKGIEPRQRICFMVVNNDHFLSIFFASICLACPIVPLHPTLSTEEIARVLIQIKPVAIFCESNLHNKIEEALSALSKIQFNAALFILGDRIPNLQTAEVLLMETGEEKTFM